MVGLLASLLSTTAQAGGFSISIHKSYGNKDIHKSYGTDGYTTNRPWGNVEPSKPAPLYQPPQPLPGSYYLGAAPGTGWYSAQMPANNSTGNASPVVEVEVDEPVVYEQQNIIYTVHVVSDGNLASLDAELPRSEGAAMELLDGPVATTRADRNSHTQQIVNTYHYKVMLLRAGNVVIPPIRFTGTYAAGAQTGYRQDNKFSIAADKPLTLQVRPADPAVRPWLPLHDLRLQTNLQQEGPAKAGHPITLTLELTARGALGTQLPSLSQQLESPQYRVYRDSTTTQNGISTNGRYLTGSRKETYTLIPLEDGLIRLPDINVAWWDVDMQTARLAGLPPTVASAGATSALGAAGRGQPSPFSIYFWLPMAIAMALIAGFWLGAWNRTRPLLNRAGSWLTASSQRVVQRGQQLGNRLSPLRHLRYLRIGFALLMPKSVRIWMCTRCLETEDDPHAWCTEFKQHVCEHLGMSSHASINTIAEKLITISPRVEPARLRELAHSLDGAVYGGRPLDFPAWKRELLQQLRPRLLLRSRARARRRTNLLPALNPHAA